MIIALPRALNPDAYYSQTNNVVETILAKTKADRKLETCGPTSATIIVDALGKLVPITTPGGWRPQPEDILAAWFNDPRNYDEMKKYRDGVDPAEIMGNEVPQWYPPALKAVFGVESKFSWGMSFDVIWTALGEGRGVLATLKKPGHYIAIVGFDTDAREVIFHDPWPGDPWPARYAGTPGQCRRLTELELVNLQPFRVEIG